MLQAPQTPSRNSPRSPRARGPSRLLCLSAAFIAALALVAIVHKHNWLSSLVLGRPDFYAASGLHVALSDHALPKHNDSASAGAKAAPADGPSAAPAAACSCGTAMQLVHLPGQLMYVPMEELQRQYNASASNGRYYDIGMLQGSRWLLFARKHTPSSTQLCHECPHTQQKTRRRDVVRLVCLALRRERTDVYKAARPAQCAITRAPVGLRAMCCCAAGSWRHTKPPEQQRLLFQQVRAAHTHTHTHTHHHHKTRTQRYTEGLYDRCRTMCMCMCVCVCTEWRLIWGHVILCPQ